MLAIIAMKKIDFMSLDARQLALLVAVYETGSVSAAAAEFNTTQSSASHTLDKLRTCLEDPLFVRAGRTLEPTARAHELVPQAREIVSRYETLLSNTTYDPAEDEAPFTLALNVTEFLPEIQAIRDGIRNKAPHARIRFLELGSRERLPELLAHNQVDLAVTVRSPTYPPFLNHSPLVEDEFMCFYDAETRDPPLTLQDYCDAEHGVLDFGGTRKSTVEIALEAHAVTRRVTIAASSVVAMGALLRGTPVIMTMQSRLRHSAFRDLACVPPPFSMPVLYFDLVWHHRSDAVARSKWLREIVTRACEGN